MINLLFFLFSILISVVGAINTSNWLILWLWIELNSLALIPILSINMSPRTIEATSKYFLFQAAGSVIILLGIMLRYYYSGQIATNGNYTFAETAIIILALAIKMGIFPSHFWFIEVMNGLNFFSGFFVAIVSKIVPLYIIIFMSINTNSPIVLIVSLLSIIIGSIFGIQQTQLRKLIALSSIAHLGWMIIIFNNVNTSWIGAILFIAYIVMVLPLFWIGNSFSIEYLAKSSNPGSNTSVGVILCLTILSIGGFPPLLGFFYKWIIFLNVINTEEFLVIVILILASLVSLFYYVQICLSIYMNSWPSIKTISESTYIGAAGSGNIAWAIIFFNVVLYYFLWIVSPISSSWNL
nr:NADH dehydrogenase subuinit 2 [Ophiocten ludwigi]